MMNGQIQGFGREGSVHIVTTMHFSVLIAPLDTPAKKEKWEAISQICNATRKGHCPAKSSPSACSSG